MAPHIHAASSKDGLEAVGLTQHEEEGDEEQQGALLNRPWFTTFIADCCSGCMALSWGCVSLLVVSVTNLLLLQAIRDRQAGPSLAHPHSSPSPELQSDEVAYSSQQHLMQATPPPTILPMPAWQPPPSPQPPPPPPPFPIKPPPHPLSPPPPPPVTPPPKTPPAMPPPIPVVDLINARYRNAITGSSALEDVGVILHSMDNQEDPEKPWAVCPKTSLHCGFLSDRMSASITYRGKTNSFGGGTGFVLSPYATRVLCAYGGDGGTRGKLCSPPGLSDSCVPGCAPKNAPDTWCDPSVHSNANDGWCDGRPWRSSDLGKFMERDRASSSYNEAVLDGFYWNLNLPHSIEAILASPDDPGARQMHAAFLSTYGLTAEDVPLLSFRKDRIDAPFVVEVGAKSHGGGLAADAASTAHRGDPDRGRVPSHGPATGDISSLGYG